MSALAAWLQSFIRVMRLLHNIMNCIAQQTVQRGDESQTADLSQTKCWVLAGSASTPGCCKTQDKVRLKLWQRGFWDASFYVDERLVFVPPCRLSRSVYTPRRLPSSLWLSVMIGPNGQRECLPAFLEDGVICRGDVVYLTPWADPLFPLWPDDAGTGLPQRALSVWTTTLEQTHRPRSLHTHTEKKCYCCPKKLRSGPYERCVD